MTREAGTGTKERKMRNQVSIYLTDDEHDAIIKEAEEKRISLNKVIRILINSNMKETPAEHEESMEKNRILQEMIIEHLKKETGGKTTLVL